mmetsp:Transcript_35342/g.100047  ORF Transcript_35342/g.100047 Transcript_35342/m.100047 type:complete len:354 (+) Transcript_35342:754-1815(+)
MEAILKRSHRVSPSRSRAARLASPGSIPPRATARATCPMAVGESDDLKSPGKPSAGSFFMYCASATGSPARPLQARSNSVADLGTGATQAPLAEAAASCTLIAAAALAAAAAWRPATLGAAGSTLAPSLSFLVPFFSGSSSSESEPESSTMGIFRRALGAGGAASASDSALLASDALATTSFFSLLSSVSHCCASSLTARLSGRAALTTSSSARASAKRPRCRRAVALLWRAFTYFPSRARATVQSASQAAHSPSLMRAMARLAHSTAWLLSSSMACEYRDTAPAMSPALKAALPSTFRTAANSSADGFSSSFSSFSSSSSSSTTTFLRAPWADGAALIAGEVSSPGTEVSVR